MLFGGVVVGCFGVVMLLMMMIVMVVIIVRMFIVVIINRTGSIVCVVIFDAAALTGVAMVVRWVVVWCGNIRVISSNNLVMMVCVCAQCGT